MRIEDFDQNGAKRYSLSWKKGLCKAGLFEGWLICSHVKLSRSTAPVVIC